MQVYVNKDGQQYGPYSVEQLREYVRQGNFTTADHACYDGQNWVTVAQVPGLIGDARQPLSQPPSNRKTKNQTNQNPTTDNIKVEGTKTEKIGGGVILISLILGISFCSGIFDEDSSDSPPASSHDKVGAWVVAQDFVEKRLKSPGSADWGWQSTQSCVSHLGNGRYEVRAWVDSQNSFGAQIRTNFVAIVSWQSGDTWQLESLEF